VVARVQRWQAGEQALSDYRRRILTAAVRAEGPLNALTAKFACIDLFDRNRNPVKKKWGVCEEYVSQL